MTELRVMTLNVRQPDKDDGENNWANRRNLLVETILDADPHLIGTQELFAEQAADILERAQGYNFFGSGRFGDDRDKHVAIFYKTAELTPIATGDFWLSETPEVPGSSSWDIIRPRHVTWGEFETKTGLRFHHFNTHFPYRREEAEARRKTAELLISRVGTLEPVVITADFNSAAPGEIHSTLTDHFQDAWLGAERRIGPDGTLNGFGRITEPRRIDWILYRAPWSAAEVSTIAVMDGAIYPSDHWPVMARFEF